MSADQKQLYDYLSNKALLRSRQFISGTWLQGDCADAFEVLDPGTARSISVLEGSSLQDVDMAIASADASFKSYSALPSRQRAQLLLKFHELVRDSLDDLAWLLVFETGKPLVEARAEVQYALTFSWWFVGECERVQGQVVQSATNPNLRFLTTLQPIGPVAILTPWNFPVALLIRKAVSALAAGCTVVAKPSPETPLSTLAIAHLVEDAGFPAGSFNVVLSSRKSTPLIGQALCTDKRIKKCAPSLKKMTLELGGLGAYIIFPDADIETAACALVANKLRHAGQTCISAQRAFVHTSVLEQVRTIILRELDKVKMGHGASDDTTLGPLQTLEGQKKYHDHLSDAKSKGGRFHMREQSVPPDGYFCQPVLVTGCTRDMLVFQEESFAPIICVAPFTAEEEVLAMANDTDMGLTSYVFTKDSARLWRMFEKLKAGNVGLNVGGSTTAAEIPFGGVDQSGFGKEAGIGAGLREYMIEKSATMSIA